MTEKLPDNLEEALDFIRKLQAENTEQKNEITELKATVDKQNIMLSNLNEMLVKDRKAMFGKSSEQLSNIEGSEQLTLFNEAEQRFFSSISVPPFRKSFPSFKRLLVLFIRKFILFYPTKLLTIIQNSDRIDIKGTMRYLTKVIELPK